MTLDLPDVPRWVEAHGIAASGEGWREDGPGGFAIGHDGARLIVLVGDVDAAAIARAHPDHALLFPLELAAAVAREGRVAERAILHTLPDPASLPDFEGAVPLDAPPADLPADLAGDLARARGTVWTVWVDDAPVSFAHAVWRSPRWFEVSVDTLPRARQLGLGTIVAAAMIRDERAHGREPVWGADAGNLASRRLAKRLGFEPVDEIGVAAPWQHRG